MQRPWKTQLVLVLLAAAMLAGGGLLQGPLDRLGEKHNLVAPGNVVVQNNPQMTLLTTVFGGFRAPIVSYLWIRAEQMKQEGRHFDAMQLAEAICQFMPTFPGVWDYAAWNMAYNISVQTHTPEERWQWVYNGVKLLRDRGIPLNPRAIMLYKQLAWIYFDKIGGKMDDMGLEYRKRWADEMQALLGAPPVGTTREVIDAFRPLADEKLLDKDPGQQAQRDIQPGKFAELMQDPPLRKCLETLRNASADGDPKALAQPLIDFANERLLELYNRYGADLSAGAARRRGRSVEVRNDLDKTLVILMNEDRQVQPYLPRLLTFLRAQKLWNVYRMDPAWMLRIMETYDIPLDWRHVKSHALYWNSYGMKVCKDIVAFDDIDTLNTGRTLSFALRDMVFEGKMAFQPDMNDPDGMVPVYLADWRFIEPAHQHYIQLCEKVAKDRNETFEKNILGDGHVNFLVDVIKILYARGWRHPRSPIVLPGSKARLPAGQVPAEWPYADKYLKYIRDAYHRTGADWNYDDLDEFVTRRLAKDFREDALTMEEAAGMVTMAIQATFEAMVRGDTEEYRRSLAFARRVYEEYMLDRPKRIRLPEFDDYLSNLIAVFLIRPEILGAWLDFEDRVILYNRLNSDPQASLLLAPVYANISDELRALCGTEEKFKVSFPPPVGLREYQQRLRPF